MLALGLAACGANQDELQAWMDQQRREVHPTVVPIEPPKKFDPQPYLMADAVDPFSVQKMAAALKQEVRQPNSLLAAEMNRRKQPLEAYPLDSMVMVGSVSKQGRPTALLRVENLLYIAEYKRRQAAPGVKVTLKNFGRDRRYPITNRFRDPGTPLPAPDVSLVTGKPTKTEAFDF